MYSNVRAVVELDDGSRYMATKFVKAAGGCSAPALKDMDAALAGIGKMKLRSLPEAPAASPLVREAQVMVRHPNYSGMQMNQLTGLYIPAKYVEFMEIRKGAALVFRMQGGISLSEDPNIRFTYAPGIAGDLSVLARDTDGNSYTTSAPPTGS
jgi:sulfur-oxidizing protein SoxY